VDAVGGHVGNSGNIGQTYLHGILKMKIVNDSMGFAIENQEPKARIPGTE
jgi:hypothetical protein